MSNTMTVGDRIKEVREGRGMSMTELANELDITVTAVSNWEGNKYSPRPAMLTKVANALQVDRTYLADGVNEAGVKLKNYQDVLDEAKAALADILNVPVNRLQLELRLVA